MRVECPTCESSIRVLDDSTSTGWAWCSSCEALFDFWDWTASELVARSGVSAPPGCFVSRPKSALPKSSSYRDNSAIAAGSGVVEFSAPLAPRWFSDAAWWVAGLSFMVGLFSLGSAVPLISVASVCGAALFAGCAFLTSGRLRVHLDSDRLKVAHSFRARPLQSGRREFDAEEIKQLYVISAPPDPFNQGPVKRYVLRGMLNGPGPLTVDLAESLSLRHALWLERELERALKIVDRPVRGEVPRVGPVALGRGTPLAALRARKR